MKKVRIRKPCIYLELPDKLKVRFKRVCQKKDLPMSWVLKKMIEKYLIEENISE